MEDEQKRRTDEAQAQQISSSGMHSLSPAHSHSLLSPNENEAQHELSR
jgi:hypothetical protein